jgi:LPXTG-motif cell wall-anchored protein
MIGPIPVAFGTSPAITLIAMVMGLLLMLAFFILWRRNA